MKIVREDPFVPAHKIDGFVVNKSEKEWRKDDKENVQRNLKLKTGFTTALDLNEFFQVSHSEIEK